MKLHGVQNKKDHWGKDTQDQLCSYASIDGNWLHKSNQLINCNNYDNAFYVIIELLFVFFFISLIF